MSHALHPITQKLLQEAEAQLTAQIEHAENEGRLAAKKWTDLAHSLREDLKKLRGTWSNGIHEQPNTMDRLEAAEKFLNLTPSELWEFAKNDIKASTKGYTTAEMKLFLIEKHLQGIDLNEAAQTKFRVNVSDMFKLAGRRGDVKKVPETKNSWRFFYVEKEEKSPLRENNGLFRKDTTPRLSGVEPRSSV